MQDLQHNILFNLGQVWRYVDLNKSIQYFIEAQKLMPNDQDTVLELLKCYIMCQDDTNFSEQLKKVTDPNLQKLCSILQKLECQSDFNTDISLKLQVG